MQVLLCVTMTLKNYYSIIWFIIINRIKIYIKKELYKKVKGRSFVIRKLKDSVQLPVSHLQSKRTLI